MKANYMVFAAQDAKSLLRSGWGAVSGLVIGLVACSPTPSPTAHDLHKPDSAYVVPWEQVEVYLQAAPSPVQVSLWLQQEKVQFYREPLHDPTYAGRYAGLQGAANLGIYLTDMAYAHATGRYQDAYDYLSAVNRLATAYGIEDIFSIERIRQLDKLQDKPDSAQKLFTQYYSEVQTRLSETGQEAMLRHMILGGWIESLHIILHLLEKEPQNQHLAEVILLQKSLTPLLLKLYSVDTLHSKASQTILAHLQAMQRTLEGLAVSESASVANAEVKKGVIQMQFRAQISLKMEDIRSIREQLVPLRQFLIQT